MDSLLSSAPQLITLFRNLTASLHTPQQGALARGAVTSLSSHGAPAHRASTTPSLRSALECRGVTSRALRGAIGACGVTSLSSRGAQLQATYVAARYRVQWQGRWVELVIGARNAVVDALLRRLRVQGWALITAYNPGSRRVAPLRNELANRRLRNALIAHGWRVLPTLVDGPGWPAEPGFFVLGLPMPIAAALGRCFGQAAVVCGARNAAPVLVWCGARE